jgi:catechol 1,2-dioxygenase
MASTPLVTSRLTTEDDITNEALRRVQATPDPRLREIMTSLITHLHAFLKEARIKENEWFKGIEFLTSTGHFCDDRRQEFILLSDTLGVSMVVDLITHGKPAGATESTVFGPFHREGAPLKEFGDNIVAIDRGGMPAVLSGRVLNLKGEPIPNAELDVWQVANDRLYDSQDVSIEGLNMRGVFRTNAKGEYRIKTDRPVSYSIPDDGPVGDMLTATGRHPWRPAHVHFVVAADGYEPVTTHIFDSEDEWLKSDAVFGVKDSLIAKFTVHETEDEAAKKYGMKAPFCTCDFDFVLAAQK